MYFERTIFSLESRTHVSYPSFQGVQYHTLHRACPSILHPLGKAGGGEGESTAKVVFNFVRDHTYLGQPIMSGGFGTRHIAGCSSPGRSSVPPSVPPRLCTSFTEHSPYVSTPTIHCSTENERVKHVLSHQRSHFLWTTFHRFDASLGLSLPCVVAPLPSFACRSYPESRLAT